MMFHKMRDKMKFVIIIVVAAMAGGALWAAGSALLTGRQINQAQAAPVVATVNGYSITVYDLYNAYIRFLQQLEQQQGPIPGRAHEAVRFQALEALVDSIVVNQEIEKRQLTASEAEIDAELQKIIAAFPSEEDYKAQLEAVGLSEAVLRSQLAYQIKIDKLQNEITAHHEVTEEEVKQAYERVRASHILIRPEGSSEEEWAAAESKAWEVHGQVTPENFAELAAEVSQDSSGSNGGELGYIYRGQTVPEFEAAVFALEVGQISEPVRSVYGYHIIMATDRIQAEGEEFEQARAELAHQIQLQKGQEDIEAWLEEARGAAEIVYMDNELNAYAQLQAGNYEDAAHYYKLAIEDHPDDGYLYASLGDVYYQMENLDEAIHQYELAVEKYSTDSNLVASLGGLYQEAERIDEAVEAYIKAAELVPNDIFMLLALYQNVNELERYEDAKIIEKLIEEYQERQAERLKEQAATETAEEEEPVQESAPEN